MIEVDSRDGAVNVLTELSDRSLKLKVGGGGHRLLVYPPREASAQREDEPGAMTNRIEASHRRRPPNLPALSRPPEIRSGRRGPVPVPYWNGDIPDPGTASTAKKNGRGHLWSSSANDPRSPHTPNRSRVEPPSSCRACSEGPSSCNSTDQSQAKSASHSSSPPVWHNLFLVFIPPKPRGRASPKGGAHRGTVPRRRVPPGTPVSHSRKGRAPQRLGGPLRTHETLGTDRPQPPTPGPYRRRWIRTLRREGSGDGSDGEHPVSSICPGVSRRGHGAFLERKRLADAGGDRGPDATPGATPARWETDGEPERPETLGAHDSGPSPPRGRFSCFPAEGPDFGRHRRPVRRAAPRHPALPEGGRRHRRRGTALARGAPTRPLGRDSRTECDRTTGPWVPISDATANGNETVTRARPRVRSYESMPRLVVCSG